jgi:hypothetical protein
MLNNTKILAILVPFTCSMHLAASANPTLTKDPVSGFCLSEKVIPTSTSVKIRVSKTKLPTIKGLSFAAASIKGDPIKVSETTTTLWKIAGEDQQEKLCIPNSQRFGIFVGNYKKGTKWSAEGFSTKWDIATCTQHGDYFECVFTEPRIDVPEDQKESVTLEVNP